MRNRNLAAFVVLLFGTIVLPGCFFVGHWRDPDDQEPPDGSPRATGAAPAGDRFKGARAAL